MIVHIFTAERYHLVPAISKGFITTYKSDAQHRFILSGSKHTNISLYKTLYEDQGFTDYSFCLSFLQLTKTLWRNRKNCILFHAGSYYQFFLSFLLGCRQVSWVCWGSGAQINKRGVSFFSAPIKSKLYNRLFTIVTLMEEDRQSIISEFTVPENKVLTISYMPLGDSITEYDTLSRRLLQKKIEGAKEKKLFVLLGNNPSCINSYMAILQILEKFKGHIIVHCMLNYSLNKDSKYNELCRLGNKLFSTDFYCDETFYPDRFDYIHYMDLCDIYICGSEKQSGLGAIETCLKLGKKVYITGKNLSWIDQEFNAIVFDSKLIVSMTLDEFIAPLNFEQKLLNFNSSVKRKAKYTAKWKNYLRILEES